MQELKATYCVEMNTKEILFFAAESIPDAMLQAEKYARKYYPFTWKKKYFPVLADTLCKFKEYGKIR